jgi:hypothetical protein
MAAPTEGGPFCCTIIMLGIFLESKGWITVDGTAKYVWFCHHGQDQEEIDPYQLLSSALLLVFYNNILE